MDGAKNELYVARNHALTFAKFTRENLKFIEEASKSHSSVHVVTQLANSLLGLVVFVWEKNFVKSIEDVPLESLRKDGWPSPELVIGECTTLGQLVRHLRNAIAHGRITFSSDSKNLEEVMLTVEDKKNRNAPVDWSARMNAAELRVFCVKFTDLVENTIG